MAKENMQVGLTSLSIGEWRTDRIVGYLTTLFKMRGL